MPKNIVIFSDGTGQAGGINFDEARTNVYKLFRACRVGPETRIDPSEQIAFYDPGLGSAADGGHFKVGWLRKFYNLLSMATGLGITANIIDCYAAIIRLYEDGDRIFLIGFSRGAYTVRSLAGVMSYCGIPRHCRTARRCGSISRGRTNLPSMRSRTSISFARPTTARRSARISCSCCGRAMRLPQNSGPSTVARSVKEGTEQANVFPYFIGVFDTVAALGNKWLAPVLVAVVLAIPVGLHFLGSWLEPEYAWAGRVTRDLGYLSVFAAFIIYLINYLKIAPRLPGYSFFKRLATLHLTRPKHQFYDKTLNVNVGYAKHAISIDENRADFTRVKWSPTAEKLDRRDEHKNLYFEQVWFPGVHADIGGGYAESEARLSDIALGWMLAAASIIPDGLKHDGSILRLWPDAGGQQHDEQACGWLKKGLRDILG